MILKKKLLFQLTTTIIAWLGTTFGSLALPIEEVLQILKEVPIFVIADADGAPIVAVGDDSEKVTGVFISRRDADKFMQELREKKPNVAAKVNVWSNSLADVVKLAQTNKKKANALNFAYMPLDVEVKNARNIPGNSYKSGVPLFVARGGPDKGYITIEHDGERVIPFFFESSQINEMVNRFKRENPAVSNSVVIDVVPMENVISTLQSSNDEMLSKIRFIPTEESKQFIRSLSADSGLPNSLTSPTSSGYPVWEEESGWTTIVRHDDEVIKVKKGSVSGGNVRSGKFAIFNANYDTQEKYLSAIGNITATCDNKDLNSDNFTVFRAYKDGTLHSRLSVSDNSSPDTWYYVRHQTYPIRHYLCNDMNPNYLKPGMPMSEVKRLLNNNGFEVSHLEAGAVTTTGPICDYGKACEVHGNHALTFITFINKKTGVSIGTGSFGYKLYEVN